MIPVLDRVVFDSEISERKILIVPIHTVRHTPYNPANRTKEGEKLRRLISEIQGRGLIYPILITSDRDVIDGNRRLAACRALGHKTIECIVSDLDRDEA
jgi:ParB-like chromosome segregation protein Spo0J